MIPLASMIRVGKWVATVAPLAAGMWYFGDYTEVRPALLKELHMAQMQIEELSKGQVLLQFNMLMEKYKMQGYLDQSDQMQLCTAAQVLGYPLSAVPGCH